MKKFFIVIAIIFTCLANQGFANDKNYNLQISIAKIESRIGYGIFEFEIMPRIPRS